MLTSFCLNADYMLLGFSDTAGIKKKRDIILMR
jgi:hypothetical protein